MNGISVPLWLGDEESALFNWLDKLTIDAGGEEPFSWSSHCTTIYFNNAEDAIAFRLRFSL